VADGLGNGGRTRYSNNVNSLLFTFNAGAPGGNLPTHPGIVWTDVGFSDYGLGIGHVLFEGYDENGFSLGVIRPIAVGEGVRATFVASRTHC